MNAGPVGAAPRTLLLADSYWPVVGGGESHSRLLASTLAELGVDVQVLTQHRFAESPAFEHVDGVPVHRVGRPGFKRFGKYLMVPPMRRWMRAHRDEFDIVYVCGLRVLGAPATYSCRDLGKPVVLRSESCEELSGAYVFEHLGGAKATLRPLARAALLWRNRAMLRADAFLAISSPIAEEYLEAGVPDDRIVRIPNGVDLDVFRSSVTGEDLAALRERLGLPADRIVLAYTGKLNRGKGIEYLVEALRLLLPRRPELHLALVGSGDSMFLSCERELREQVDRDGIGGHVTFTGYRDDVADFLRASDLFVMPSEMEALSISLIEALACGLPAVVTAVGGLPDVARDGRDALLVPPADASALAGALGTLLDDRSLAARLAASARERMREKFDIRAVAARHVELFSELQRGRVSTATGGALR